MSRSTSSKRYMARQESLDILRDRSARTADRQANPSPDGGWYVAPPIKAGNMARERWRNLTPNLSKPFAYRSMPASTVTYAKSERTGKAVGWTCPWYMVGPSCPWDANIRPTSVGMLTLDGIGDILKGFIKPQHKSGYRTISKVKPMT